MKQSRFSEEQIIGILKQHEAGRPTAEVWREAGISNATFYAWNTPKGHPVRRHERERGATAAPTRSQNAKLKRVVADLTLNNVALKDVLSKNGSARPQKRGGGLSAQEWFTSLGQARGVLAAWQEDYNTVRPHSALNYLAPRSWAQLKAEFSTFE